MQGKERKRKERGKLRATLRALPQGVAVRAVQGCSGTPNGVKLHDGTSQRPKRLSRARSFWMPHSQRTLRLAVEPLRRARPPMSSSCGYRSSCGHSPLIATLQLITSSGFRDRRVIASKTSSARCPWAAIANAHRGTAPS